MGATHKDQERETASATLVSGMHFIGAIDDFRWTSMPRKVPVVWALAFKYRFLGKKVEKGGAGNEQ